VPESDLIDRNRAASPIRPTWPRDGRIALSIGRSAAAARKRPRYLQAGGRRFDPGWLHPQSLQMLPSAGSFSIAGAGVFHSSVPYEPNGSHGALLRLRPSTARHGVARQVLVGTLDDGPRAYLDRWVGSGRLGSARAVVGAVGWRGRQLLEAALFRRPNTSSSRSDDPTVRAVTSPVAYRRPLFLFRPYPDAPTPAHASHRAVHTPARTG
jgi:hypothetical protein